jgi:hypothetical protein
MYLPRVFVYIPGTEMNPKKTKQNGGPFRSERVPMSPSEQANRIRRAARQLQHGVLQQDLISQGFKATEIERAKAMIGKK